MTEATLGDVLKFATGLSSIPPMKSNNLSLQYLLDERPLPTANACFGIIHLPTCHNSQDSFNKAFDTAVLNSKDHFGQE